MPIYKESCRSEQEPKGRTQEGSANKSNAWIIRARPLRRKEVLSCLSGQSGAPRSQSHRILRGVSQFRESESWHSSGVGTSRKLSPTPPTEGLYGQTQRAESTAICQMCTLQLICFVNPKEATTTRSSPGVSLGILSYGTQMICVWLLQEPQLGKKKKS